MRRAIAGVLCAATPLAAAASALPDRTACFERAYDAAHLAAHPGQKVRRMRAVYTVADGEVQVHLDVWLRDDPIHYSMYADCAPDGAGRRCATELDAGFWRVEATADGGLRVGNGEFWINPDAADSQEPLPEGRRLAVLPDDHEWLLVRVPVCP